MPNPQVATLTLRLTPTMKAAVESKARERNVTLSDVIRDTLLASINMCPSCGRPYHGASADTAAQ